MKQGMIVVFVPPFHSGLFGEFVFEEGVVQLLERDVAVSALEVGAA